MPEKKCGKCKKIKLISCFSKNNSKKIGYQSYCKICISKYFKDPRVLPIIRKKHKENMRKNKLKPENLVKIKCREETNNAIRSGILIKKRCEVCQTLKTEAHHDDYSEPLKVRWLCKKCHTNEHFKEQVS